MGDVKNIAVLGSTGSVGRQTLEVAGDLGINVLAIAFGQNIAEAKRQIGRFRPKLACAADPAHAKELSGFCNETVVTSGAEGLAMAAAMDGVDTVVNALAGGVGLLPTISAVRAGKDVAIANKESLVTSGELITREAKENGVNLFPIDSEHSAVYQCLQTDENRRALKRIILTASGGPFRGRKRSELENISPADALRHPTWSMGRKISVDSATLMNKGLEVIEAKWLFGTDVSRIQVLIHPQSVIHSMVEFEDGCVMAQLGAPDMRLPIQYALAGPERLLNSYGRLDFKKLSDLTFEEPDTDSFPCLALAFAAAKAGGLIPAVMNAANESAVNAFLDGRLPFLRIPDVIEKVMYSDSMPQNFRLDGAYTVSDALEAGSFARDEAERHIGRF